MENINILEYCIIMVLVAAIVVIQVRILLQNRKKTIALSQTFDKLTLQKLEVYVPKKRLWNITWYEMKSNLERFTAFPPDDEELSDYESVTVVRLRSSHNNVLQQIIENSVNTYLLRNKGAASDFALIKDIVERYCDAEQKEIDAQIPMPLYLGLMGTVAGIIAGLGLIAFGEGGFSAFIDNPDSVIGSLMSGVALAMIASLSGILCTTLSSWTDKSCGRRLEAGKNNFYTWIQTELLPVLSSSTVSELNILSRNLNRFNASFKDTIKRLDQKLAEVGNFYTDQLELLRLLQQIDVNKMATANVKVLQALNASMGNLDKFVQFLDTSTEYVENVRALNEELHEHQERTEALVEIGKFYKENSQLFEKREDAIRQAVVKTDDALQETLARLTQNAEHAMEQMHQTFVRCNEQIEKAAAEQEKAFGNQSKKLDMALDIVGSLPSLHAALTEIRKSSAEQTDTVRALNGTMKAVADALRNIDRQKKYDGAGWEKRTPWWKRIFRRGRNARKKKTDGPLRDNPASPHSSPTPTPPAGNGGAWWKKYQKPADVRKGHTKN